MSALILEHDHTITSEVMVDDPRFPYTGCPMHIVVFGRRQWCQHGHRHVGLHY